MPGLDGIALAAEARRRRPELKVVYATGHPRDEGAAERRRSRAT